MQSSRKQVIAGLAPGLFPMVMATGIVAIDTAQRGFRPAALLLATVAAAVLLAAWLLLGWRLVGDTAQVLDELQSHSRAPGYLAAVAGTAVVGSACLALGGPAGVSLALLAFGGVMAVAGTYAVLVGLTVTRSNPPLAEGIDGSWLLPVVATESLAVLAASLLPGFPPPAAEMLAFIALCTWLVGGLFYTWLMTLLVYRQLFFRFEPRDLRPSWWINLGAMAISALAGALLVIDAPRQPLLAGLLPFLRAVTLMEWALAAWWAPLLVLLTVRQLRAGREHCAWGLGWWSAVFPLGMFCAATGKVAEALDLRFLAPVADALYWVAVLAWLAVAVAVTRGAVQAARTR